MKHLEEDIKSLQGMMIKEQLLRRDIKDKSVIDVFSRVPRHMFVDSVVYEKAYGDFPLPISKGQTISQPYIVALMVQSLGLLKSDKILEIGTGSGYETAILAELGGSVFSIERIQFLGVKAKELLEKLGYKNINIKIGDGTLGWEEFAPYNKIIVAAGAPSIPKSLLDQLSENGEMIIPVGSRFSQRLVLVEKDIRGDVLEKELCGCVFVPLVGRYGWQDEYMK